MDLVTLGLIGAAGAGGYLLYTRGTEQGKAQNSGLTFGDTHIGNDTLNSLAGGVKSFFTGLSDVGGQPQTSVGSTGYSPPPPPPPPPFVGGDPAGGGQAFAGGSPDDWQLPAFGTGSGDATGGTDNTTYSDGKLGDDSSPSDWDVSQ